MYRGDYPGAAADTLHTPGFEITITDYCAEGEVSCDTITARVTDRAAGINADITSHTLHSVFADRVTPCRFLYDQFEIDARTYRAYEDGGFGVTDGDGSRSEQRGTWDYDE